MEFAFSEGSEITGILLCGPERQGNRGTDRVKIT